jgi:hypothetical protein
MKQMVGPEVMKQRIVSVVAVRRPLDVPSIRAKIGLTLSHSGCVATTEEGAYVLIEYMWGGLVYVSLCNSYTPGKKGFKFRHFPFLHDDVKQQEPNRRVTVGEFAEAMIEVMQGKGFAVLYHNCHHARYLTMKRYGMKSKNPDAYKTNSFFQGWKDFFKPKDYSQYFVD